MEAATGTFQPSAPAIVGRGNRRIRGSRAAALVLCVLTLAGCATAPAGGRAGGGAGDGFVADPLEPFNRSMFAFNDAVDRAVLRPAAVAYEAAVPIVFRDMVGNFFGNLDDVRTVLHQLLQGKPAEAFSDLSRVVVNTTFGFGGLADVASEMAIEKHDEDFGQTLGVWGVNSGPYLFLPFFGPSSIRDGFGRIFDIAGDPLGEIDSQALTNGLWFTRAVDIRLRLFPAERLLEGAALDKYSFTRDAWLQRRRNQVYDGNPPFDEGDREGDDEGDDEGDKEGDK